MAEPLLSAVCHPWSLHAAPAASCAVAFMLKNVIGFQDLLVYIIYLESWKSAYSGDAESPRQCFWNEHHSCGLAVPAVSTEQHCFPEGLRDSCCPGQPQSTQRMWPTVGTGLQPGLPSLRRATSLGSGSTATFNTCP